MEQYEARLKDLARVDGLPDIRPAVLEAMLTTRRPAMEKILGGSGPLQIGRSKAQRRAAVQQILAACGWEVQLQSYSVGAANGSPSVSVTPLKSPAPGAATDLVDSQSVVLHCSMCAARVGLWSYKLPNEITRPLWQRNIMSSGSTSTTWSAGAQPQTPQQQPGISAAPLAENVQKSLKFTLAGGDLDTLAMATPGSSSGTAARMVKCAAAAPLAPVFGSKSSTAVPVFGLQSFAGTETATGATQTPTTRPASAPPPADPSASPPPPEHSSANGKQSREAAAQETPEDGQTSKRRRVGEPLSADKASQPGLDPIGLHRPFCAWVSTKAAGTTGLKCGWMHVLEALVSAPSDGIGEITEPVLADEEPEPDCPGPSVDMYAKRFMSALYDE